MLIALVVGLACLAGVAVRNHAPVAVLCVLATVSVLLHLGPVHTLVCLSTVVTLRRGLACWLPVAFASGMHAFGTVLDTLADRRSASVLQTFVTQPSTPPTEVLPVPPLLTVCLVVLPLTLVIGFGMYRRLHAQRATAQDRSATLEAQLARSEERTRIASEIHDVLGHRLSTMSLQAGALESMATTSPALAEKAAALRAQAAHSVEDLRAILHVIGAERPAPQLTELQEILDDATSLEQPVTSSVFLTDASLASPELAHAVVRIVQESLTNARRHAPGQPVSVNIRGGGGDSIVICVRNGIPASHASSSAPASTRRGLVGMEERATSVGGTLSAGAQDGEFIVHATLPWNSR